MLSSTMQVTCQWILSCWLKALLAARQAKKHHQATCVDVVHLHQCIGLLLCTWVQHCQASHASCCHKQAHVNNQRGRAAGAQEGRSAEGQCSETGTCSDVHRKLYHAFHQRRMQVLAPQADMQVREHAILLDQAVASHMDVHSTTWWEAVSKIASAIDMKYQCLRCGCSSQQADKLCL